MTSSLRLVKVLPNWYYMALNLTSATTSLHYNHNYTSEVVRPSASGFATSHFTLLATKCINQKMVILWKTIPGGLLTAKPGTKKRE